MIPAFFNIGTGEVIILIFLVLLLFGGKKIPELIRGIVKGLRSFRQGMNDISSEINTPAEKDSTDDRK